VFTRRTMRGALHAALMLTAAAGVAATSACSDRSKAPPAPAMTSAELLRHAADSVATLRSLFFTLAAQPVVPGIRFGAVAGGDGTVVWPDRLVFRGTMQSTPTLAAPVVIAMCGPDRYLELGDGNFMRMEALPNVHRLLFAPDTGLVPAVLTGLEQVSAPEAAKVGDVATWRLNGTVADRLLAALPGRTAPAVAPLRAELWIGQEDLRLHRAILSGPMFDGDSTATVRTLTFSRFNEPLPLTVPRGTSPCADPQKS
jgi:hypothetical protein